MWSVEIYTQLNNETLSKFMLNEYPQSPEYLMRLIISW